jgi:hypothetical protein
MAFALALTGCHPRSFPHWPPPPASGSPDKPFNVVWKQGDLNGLPLNPIWGAQVPKSSQLPPPPPPPDCVRRPDQKPACTDQDTLIDSAVFPNLLICSLIPASQIHGHVDWMPAEYVGGLTWWNFADDWDYNFAIVPLDYAGLTTYNNTIDPSGTPLRFIEAEFDSRETTDRFVTRWWTHFRNVAAQFDNEATQTLLAGDKNRVPQAVVVGLFGLDCEHDCRSEVHPVYGFAAEASDHADDNVWVMFVRNWGNEGFCSQYDHQIHFNDNKITFMLPRATKGIATIDAQKTEFAVTDGSGISFPDIKQVAGEGTSVTFTLPPPENHALAEFVLHLTWKNDTYSPPKWKMKINNFGRLMADMKPNLTQTDGIKEDEVEDYLHKLLSLKDRKASQQTVAVLPEASRHRLQSPLTQANVPIQVSPSGSLKQQNHDAVAPRQQGLPKHTVQPDEQKLVRDCEFIRSVCSKYNNSPPTDRIPNFPQLCSQLDQQEACSKAADRAQNEFKASAVK